MWTEDRLNELLTTPSEKLVEDMKKIKGDIMVLGAGGKMGPTLCTLAKNACIKAGVEKRVMAVSRFSDPIATKLLQDNGVETIACDLLAPKALDSLPDCENIIYMAGRKFGTDGSEYLTWAMNAWLPSLVAERFKKSNIVVFSSGNIYPFMAIANGGCNESIKPIPIGEYAMSTLARERMFEYGSKTYGTNVFMYRLNYAVDLRYGVLFDIAQKVYNKQPISLSQGSFNCIWQGDANEIAIRGLLHAQSPCNITNVTGPEVLSVRKTAKAFGEAFGVEPIFEGEEETTALLSDSQKMCETFGYPTVTPKTLIQWQAQWILDGGRSLGKPTHFEEKKGNY